MAKLARFQKTWTQVFRRKREQIWIRDRAPDSLKAEHGLACKAAIGLAVAAIACGARAQDADKPTDQAPPNKIIRDVTPPGVLRVFRTEGGNARQRRGTSIAIDHALVKADGVIEGGGFSLRLYGVVFPDSKRLCIDNKGARWPCGKRGYISLYNKVRDDRVDCAPRDSDRPNDKLMTADCFVGDLDLADWLLREGLVTRAADDKALVAAENAAKQAKAGLWGDGGR